ncbi:diphthine synthase [archaeon]|nr:diphthine synthase [archaeon]|tara:strand:+ start:1169 stop:1870 length:702 start_codon:yes stop_codon:yes gene_type:complete
MLYLIGTGLGSEKDLTERAKDVLNRCSDIYIEEYTNQFLGDLGGLADNIKKLSREQVESDFLVNTAKDADIALLIVGDPLSATTHMQILKDCKDSGVDYEVIHNTSIITAVAIAGLSLYKYGRITTLCFPEKGWDPEMPYEIIEGNQKAGLHTLVLLDTRNGDEYMTCEQAHEMLLEKKAVKNTDKLIFCYALGSKHQKVEYSTKPTGGNTPCCILVPGKVDEKEQEFLEMWK